MSKLTCKCPNCGAMMPVDVKYCRRCHAKMDSGRVEVLSTPPAKDKRPQKRSRDEDALRNLPKPVRPVEEAPVTEAPVTEAAAEETVLLSEAEQTETLSTEDGFVPTEEEQERAVAAAMKGAVVRRERRAPANDGTPRPVSTARGAGAQMPPARDKDKNLWQIITILAIILIIIVVAILLVIRLNRPAGNTSETFETNQEEPGAPATAPAEAPEGLVVPTATPSASPTPTAVPTPTATPLPAATMTPTPAPTMPGNVTVTGVNDTVYINGNGVNVRSGPGTEYDILGTENNGKQLARTGRTSNGWSQVAYNGQTAYVIDSYLTTTQPSGGTNTNTNTTGATTGTGTVKVTAASGANIRSGPGTNYDILGVAYQNTELTKTGTSGGWTQVSYNGQTGYVSTNLVSDSSAGTTTGATTGATTGGVTAATGTLTVTGNGVNIRSGPGTEYSRLGSVNAGTTLTVTGTSGNWYQVSYNGQTAYIIADYVKMN